MSTIAGSASELQTTSSLDDLAYSCSPFYVWADMFSWIISGYMELAFRRRSSFIIKRQISSKAWSYAGSLKAGASIVSLLLCIVDILPQVVHPCVEHRYTRRVRMLSASPADGFLGPMRSSSVPVSFCPSFSFSTSTRLSKIGSHCVILA
jgi:hypothetical protein